MALISKEDLLTKFDTGALLFQPEVKRIIKIQPEVDAVPVVRCKDCKYMTEHYDTNGNAPYWTCYEWGSETDYDGFCHYAERRTDGTD